MVGIVSPKLVLSDPDREVILQEIYFEALTGKLSDYQVHAIMGRDRYGKKAA
jgi:hypothetical protein